MHRRPPRRFAALSAALFAVLLAQIPLADALEPQVNYMLQCMGCHTPDGSGAPDRVPSFKGTLGPFSDLPDGRRYLIQVPGASQSSLTDAELAVLINWMIENLGVTKPRHFRQFTPVEVAAYRRTPLVEVRATRERLLALVKSP